MKKLIFTHEEIRALKEMAQDKLRFERIFLYDENGKKFSFRRNIKSLYHAMTSRGDQ